jgi:hypothetical protein
MLQGQGTLEKLAAVESAAEDKMSLQKGTRVAENLQDFVLCHGGKG